MISAPDAHNSAEQPTLPAETAETYRLKHSPPRCVGLSGRAAYAWVKGVAGAVTLPGCGRRESQTDLTSVKLVNAALAIWSRSDPSSPCAAFEHKRTNALWQAFRLRRWEIAQLKPKKGASDSNLRC